MPRRYGCKATSIYDCEAEGLLGALCSQALECADPSVTDSQNVADRAPQLPEASVRRRLRGRNVALESRIRRRIMRMPRIDPAVLGVAGAAGGDGDDDPAGADAARIRELRRGGFDWQGRRLGLRPLLKVKAHQADGLFDWEIDSGDFEPNVFTVFGNKIADAGAGAARQAAEQAGFAQIRYPAGGFRFFLTWQAAAVVEDPSAWARARGREEALHLWAERAVQGAVARAVSRREVHSASMRMGSFLRPIEGG